MAPCLSQASKLILVSALFICMFGSAIVHAQPSLTWSNPHDYKASEPSFYIPGKINNSFYLLRYDASATERPVYIQQFNQGLHHVKDTVLLKEPTEQLLGAFTRDSTLVLLYLSAKSGKEYPTSLKALVFDESLNVLQSGTQLIQFEENPFKNGQRNFRWHFDPESGYFAIGQQVSDTRLRITVFDKQLEPTNSKLAGNNIHDNQLIRQVRLAYPHVLVLFGPKEESREKIMGMSTYFTSLDGEKEIYTQLEKGNLVAVRGQIRYNLMQQQFMFAGMYKSTENDEEEGFVISHWDVHSPEPQPAWKGVPESDFYLHHGPDAPTTDLGSFILKDVLLRSDGGGLIFLEKRTEIDRTLQGPGVHGFPSTMNRRVFNFQDVIVVSINPDGSLHWSQVVKKEQRSNRENDMFHSIGIALTPTKLHIFYNERNRRQGVVFYDVNRLGERSSELIQNELTNNRIPLPTLSRQTGPNEVVMPVLHRNQTYSLVRMEF